MNKKAKTTISCLCVVLAHGVLWAIYIIFVLMGGPASAHTSSVAGLTLSGIPRVYDGDSIFFGKKEVRFDAIDAPEHDQACKDKQHKFWACGITARDQLRRMIGQNQVQCIIRSKDRYRRLLGVCFVGGMDLNAAMVRTGNAIAYHHFSEKYAPQEAYAKAEGIGIWQDAHFTEPYYCRHLHADHTCYAYDFTDKAGRVTQYALIGRSRAVGAPP